MPTPLRPRIYRHGANGVVILPSNPAQPNNWTLFTLSSISRDIRTENSSPFFSACENYLPLHGFCIIALISPLVKPASFRAGDKATPTVPFSRLLTQSPLLHFITAHFKTVGSAIVVRFTAEHLHVRRCKFIGGRVQKAARPIFDCAAPYQKRQVG